MVFRLVRAIALFFWKYIMKPDKNNKYFRQVSHPRENLELSQESIDYLKSKGKSIPAVNPVAVYKELLNYFDQYDVGLDIGNKKIRHSPDRDKANQVYFIWNKKPSNYDADIFSRKSWNKYQKSKNVEISNTKFNLNKVGEHITKQKKWYYTCSPFCSMRVLGTDIDNRTTNPEAVLPFLKLLLAYYPNSFYDNGSSGKSLHYYPKIDMLPLYEYYKNNTSISCTWAKYANDVIRYTGKIFQIYGRNILCPENSLNLKTSKKGESQLVPEYQVEFDAFKGTYPDYDFYVNKKGQVVITEMLKNGVLHKYPNIFTVEDLVVFRDSPVYSIIYHLSLSIYICNIILLSGCYSEKDYQELSSALKEIEPVLIAHDVFLPCQSKNTVALISKTTAATEEERENKELSIYNGTFENITDIRIESDAFIRSKRYLYYCYIYYLLNEGREPTKEEYRQNYRQDIGIGPEDNEDKFRLNYIYDTNIDRMRKYTFGSLSNRIEQMVGKLDVSQDDINRMSTYCRKLCKREIAIAAVWIELCLTNADYIEKKSWWSMGKGEHYSRELTVPMTSLENFIECLKSKDLNNNGCNPKKARALRELLIDLQWIQCVDDSVIIAADNGNRGGRARRYILLPGHPNYQRFESIVGKDRIEYWKQFRQEQICSRAVKKRKVG